MQRSVRTVFYSVFVACMLVFAYRLFDQWRAERTAVAAAVSKMHGPLGDIREAIRSLDLRVKSLGELIRKDGGAMRQLLSRIESTALPRSSEETGERDESDSEPAAGGMEDLESDVALPGGVNPTVCISQDLSALLLDPKINPEAKQLDRIEAARVHLELTKARTRVETLEAEIEVQLAEGIETLRDRGDFVEYLETDLPPDSPPGLVTVGEQTDAGTIRFYRLFPEEFGEVYGLREERQREAEAGLRSLLGALAK